MRNVREIKLNETRNYIHLMSGGLDSSYSLLKIAKENKKNDPLTIIHPIFFDYGQFVAETEWDRIQKIIEYIRNFLKKPSTIDDALEISLKSELFHWTDSDAFWGPKGKRTPEIENRNIVLVSVLTSYLIACAKHQDINEANFKISSGFKQSEMDDCSEDFFNKYKELLSIYKPKMTFEFPILKNWSRKRVINETKKLLGYGDETEFGKFYKLTVSCYWQTKDGEPCGGVCSKCEFLKTQKD
ncbi:MAG: 7-cyano-7-deazaguanine synthase [Promethearchaeota archaeon]